METSPSQPRPRGAVVVGVDGSAHSRAAVDWAATHAERERRTLVLLHAVDAAAIRAHSHVPGTTLDPAPVVEGAVLAGERLCEETRAELDARYADLVVHCEVSELDPRAALLAASEQAALVVLGSRGRGPIVSLLLGSVSVAVSRHAHSPLVVVRPGEDRTAGLPVVAAVDASAGSRPVLEYAFRYASANGLPVTVVHTHADLVALAYGLPEVTPPLNVEDATLALSESLAGFGEKFPEVPVHRELRGQRAVDAMLDLGRAASLLVIGRQHPPGLRGLAHTGTATSLLEHATCPVAVVPVD